MHAARALTIRERARGAAVRALCRALAVFGAALAVGCAGAQSSLAPAGLGAERIARLFWLMTVGAFVIWFVVVGLSVYAGYFARRPYDARRARWLVIGGGVVFPTVLLAALLVHGLAMLPDLLAPPPAGSLKVQVVGEQWWWRVRYFPPGSAPVDLANEIRLPVGAAVEFQLESPDVIHSFWIPALGGKKDMIPGRQTRQTLEATRVGTFRGSCAEYCGDSHAWMSFPVVVQEKPEFERWLAEQARPALESSDQAAVRGRNVFFASGCGACHAVRGTQADGSIGPDLTHVGGRLSLGAGLLGNEVADFRRWVGETHRIKPGARMPAFGMLPHQDLDALAIYLESLQ